VVHLLPLAAVVLALAVAAPAPTSTQPPAKSAPAATSTHVPPAATPTATSPVKAGDAATTPTAKPVEKPVLRTGEAVPAASLFGIPTDDAKKIVYVTDRSGDILDVLKWEILRSIKHLRPDQEFDVLSIRPGPPGEMAAKRLVPPTPANIEMAKDFLETIVAGGMSTLDWALKRAFALKPDAIYLVDAYALDPDELNLLRQLNADKKVKVHFITFYKTDEPALKKVAAEFGGQCRYLSDDDIERLMKSPPDEEPPPPAATPTSAKKP
jgi:hypothetical protein